MSSLMSPFYFLTFAIASAGCGCGGFDLVIVVNVVKVLNSHWSSSFCPERCWLWCFRSLSLTNNQSQALQMTFLCRMYIGHCWFKKYRYSGHFLLHIIVRIGEIIAFVLVTISIIWLAVKGISPIITVLTCLLTISLMSMQAKMFVPVFFTS